ncbi:hypothetical protein [Allosphingosinicella sp.]|uniref:hypothetical protein n=1 Tax=Allosphingosinicella sp. TaxID=2823234 RepID=UPI002F1E4C1C
MARNLITSAAAIAALVGLSACNSEPKAEAGNNSAANSASAKAPVELPPSIEKSRIYRCRDNSLVYVDFLTNGTAAVRTSQTGVPTSLSTEGGNPPYSAEGYSVSANADQATIAVPGRAAQSCRAGR